MGYSGQCYLQFSIYITLSVIRNVLFVDGLGQGHCSVALVSGPYGVADDQLSATSTIFNIEAYSAKHGRLHSTTSWIPQTMLNQYIQVDFHIDEKLVAVQTQGRHDYPQFVKSYAVSYSTDNVIWTYVKDKNNMEKIFPGNSDQNTIVTNHLPAAVIAKYLRIHPRTWTHTMGGLRFEVIGCRATSSWKVHPISIADYTDSLWSKSASDLGKCATFCYHHTSCQSFVYSSDTGICRGFEQECLHGYRLDVLRGDLYFLRTSSLDNHVTELKERGYTITDIVFYKIYTDLVNVTFATSVCKNDSTGLLAIRNLALLNILQKKIENNPNINSKPYVSGSRVNDKWVHYNNFEIPATLWAEGEPKVDSGDCVALSSKGLIVTRCTSERYFICGY